jgi:hypothetical protein
MTCFRALESNAGEQSCGVDFNQDCYHSEPNHLQLVFPQWFPLPVEYLLLVGLRSKFAAETNESILNGGPRCDDSDIQAKDP